MRSIKLAVCSILALCAVMFATAPVCCQNFPAGGGDSLPDASPASCAIRFYQRYISDLRYGHCRFEPSCSQYALEAMNECGFIKGSALAADRLVRCHSDAQGAYKKSLRGRLLDSPNGNEIPCRLPRVPDWLLPSLNDTAPQLDWPLRIFGSPDSAAVTSTVLRWDVSFANALSARGDCWRAETEYERIAFCTSSTPLRFWASMMAGRCYFRVSEWNEAATRFQRAGGEASTREEESLVFLMAASARFNAGNYEESERILRSFDPDAGYANRTDILLAMGALAGGAWVESADAFSRIAEESSDSLSRQKMLLLARDARRGFELPRRKPLFAAALSTVVPGTGQCYTGRPFDGLRHFIFDGLLIFSVVQLFRSEQYAPGYLLGGFTLPFYVGNIMGARRSAERFNACKRLEYVAGSLDRSDSATALK